MLSRENCVLLSIPSDIPLKSNPSRLIFASRAGENYHHGLRSILCKILAHQTISIAPTTNMLLIQKASVMLVGHESLLGRFPFQRFH